MIFFIRNKYFLYLYLLYFKVEENADFSPIHPSTNPTENFYFHYSVMLLSFSLNLSDFYLYIFKGLQV